MYTYIHINQINFFITNRKLYFRNLSILLASRGRPLFHRHGCCLTKSFKESNIFVIMNSSSITSSSQKRRQHRPSPLDIESKVNAFLNDSLSSSSEENGESMSIVNENYHPPTWERGPPPPEEGLLIQHSPPFWREGGGYEGRGKKKLSKQLSMLETSRELEWEKRRRRQIQLEKDMKSGKGIQYLTDEDLKELRGCIELGFGFDEKQGAMSLCKTLPALDFYFAVTRQVSNCSNSPLPSPNTPARKSSSDDSTPSSSLGERSSSFGSIMSESDSLKILGPPGSFNFLL